MAHIAALLLLCPFAFFTVVTSKDCGRPVLPDNAIAPGVQRISNPGVVITLSCKRGHSFSSGSRTIVCANTGVWTKTNLKCDPVRCPYPHTMYNGEIQFESEHQTEYKSIISYTCNEGYILHGHNRSECQADGSWSTPTPECKPVTCGLAPIPEFGLIIYDKYVRGNTTEFGLGGTYHCLAPFVVTGNARGQCTASGSWTKPPECRLVTCPPPQQIENGFMSSRDERQYDYKESIKYGCNGDYRIDGIMESTCQGTGEWSQLPSCKGPCTVGLQRGRILYEGQKRWIEDLKPKRVFHHEIISVYCLNKDRVCGYAVSTQCIDGQLILPECFEEPGALDYTLHASSLPSEIQQC